MAASEAALTREEVARLEMARTAIDGATARVLVVFLLALITIVPVVEIIRTTRAAPQATAWAELSGIPGRVTSEVAAARGAGGGAWPELVAANGAVRDALRRFETGLNDESAIGTAARPHVQLALITWLGGGSESVLPGRERWLFYAPDLQSLTGASFLDERALGRRLRSTSESSGPLAPDPRPAILAFERELDARGIALILVPTPVKPTVHPEKLSRRYEASGRRPQNPSYDALIDELRRNGVIVFDPSEVLTAAVGATGAPQYLATDTHWRPEAMQLVAGQLADRLRATVSLPPAAPAGYVSEQRDVRALGDVATMLDLPSGQTRYLPEAVTVRRILGPDGSMWRAAADADVLLLGDSFSNIYSLPSMGWGDGAGFAEQLSFALQWPVDKISQNDQGAHATRLLLRRAGAERLRGKRVVIYQFAARELALGDWRVVQLPQ